MIEPVDADYRPGAPGQAAHTVLLTNLANRVQPIIRYNLGDSITVRPDPCACGSALPAIRVEGRRDETLWLRAASGEAVPLLPLPLAAVVEEAPGVRRFQVIQTGPATLTIRLEALPGSDPAQCGAEVARRLRAYLAVQGLPAVRIEHAAEPPARDLLTGKFRQVWAAREAGPLRA